MKEYKNSPGMTISLKQYVITHLKNGDSNCWDEDIIWDEIENDDTLRPSEKKWCFENYHEIENEYSFGRVLPKVKTIKKLKIMKETEIKKTTCWSLSELGKIKNDKSKEIIDIQPPPSLYVGHDSTHMIWKVEYVDNNNMSSEMKRLLKEHEGNYDSIIPQLQNILSVYDDFGYGVDRDEIFDVLEILGEPYC